MSGGKRKGAGRPPSPPGTIKRPISTKLDPVILAYLATVPNKAVAIEDAIRRSKGFKLHTK